jgi:plasmid stabilization system protein ParE
LTPLAEADVIEIFGDLQYIRAGLGKRFLARLRQTFEQLEWMPEMFGLIWENVRAIKVRKFRYVVYYTVQADRVEVMAVLHASRDDSAWKSRG